MSVEDRRRSDRVRMPTVASITTLTGTSSNDQGVGSVVDVSRHGVRLHAGQPPALGDWVRLRFALDDVFHCIEGVTIRVDRNDQRGGYDVGVEWDTGDPEKLMFLERFVTVQEKHW